MKKYLLIICFLVSTTTLLKAQTGTNGLVAQINSPYILTPTTVDSTTTITIQFCVTYIVCDF